MQQTSLFSYYKLIELNELGQRQKEVYNLFKQCGIMTNQEVSIRLRLSINQVTPRVKELRDYGLIEKKDIVMQKNNRPAIRWGLVK